MLTVYLAQQISQVLSSTPNPQKPGLELDSRITGIRRILTKGNKGYVGDTPLGYMGSFLSDYFLLHSPFLSRQLILSWQFQLIITFLSSVGRNLSSAHFCKLMFMEQTDFQYPNHGLLQAFGVVPDAELGQLFVPCLRYINLALVCPTTLDSMTMSTLLPQPSE